MLIVVFSLNLGWFPTSGMENFALFYLALYTRLMRASMLEQAGQDYVTTARADEKAMALRVGAALEAMLPVMPVPDVS